MNLQYGVQPFWFWNGDMEEHETIRQMDEMFSQGICGFLIHPRQGLEIPYLSEPYFQKVETVVKEAEKRGMEVWLYDEFPYPSGVSGGEVLLDHPEYSCKELTKTTAEVSGGNCLRLFAPWGKVLLARAYRVTDGVCDWNDYLDLEQNIGTGFKQDIFQLSGLTSYSHKRFFQGDAAKFLQWTPLEGCWKVYVFTEAVLKHFKYFETFTDPLNKDAVLYYIKTTHERYKKHLGKYFGSTIKGIFTDEVTAFPPEQPWSPQLPALVLEYHNLDLISYLPALFEDMGPITAKIRYAYWNAATEGFIHSYDLPVYQWCEDNNLLYIGEKPIMRSKQLEYVHIPGIDTGHQKVGSRAVVVSSKYRANGKIASSAAHFYHKPGVLCEALHSIGWGMTIQDVKWIFDWLAVQGVNWYILHGFYYSTDGLKKHDAPPSSFYQMPWWSHMHHLSAYAEQLGDFLLNTVSQVQILLVDPVTSFWTADSQAQTWLKEEFAAMQNLMLENQLNYYIIDPQLLASGSIIQNGKDTGLQIGEEIYTTIILPPMTNLEDCAIRCLNDYTGKGGFLGCVQRLPTQDIQQLDPTAAACFLQCTLYEKIDEYIDAMKHRIPADWFITPLDHLGTDQLIGVHGSGKEDKPIFFVVNLSRQTRKLLVAYKDTPPIQIVLASLESRFLWSDHYGSIENVTFDNTPQLNSAALPNPAPEYILSLDQDFGITINRPNALRLGLWNAILPDGQQGIVDSFPLIDQLEQSGLKMPIHQKSYFGCPKELDFIPTNVEYHTHFMWEQKSLPDSPVYLLMEPGSLLGDWFIHIGEIQLSESDFFVHEIYSNTNLVTDISPYIRFGNNTISIMIRVTESFGGIRNPIYLFGDFSVFSRSGQWYLKDRNIIGSFKDMVSSGLPHYAGTVIYETFADDMLTLGQDLHLIIEDPSLQDSVIIQVNDWESDSRSWSPYRFTIPFSCLKQYNNRIRIIRDTTLIGLFEGQQFNIDTHRYETIGGIDDE